MPESVRYQVRYQREEGVLRLGHRYSLQEHREGDISHCVVRQARDVSHSLLEFKPDASHVLSRQAPSMFCLMLKQGVSSRVCSSVIRRVE